MTRAHTQASVYCVLGFSGAKDGCTSDQEPFGKKELMQDTVRPLNGSGASTAIIERPNRFHVEFPGIRAPPETQKQGQFHGQLLSPVVCRFLASCMDHGLIADGGCVLVSHIANQCTECSHLCNRLPARGKSDFGGRSLATPWRVLGHGSYLR